MIVIITYSWYMCSHGIHTKLHKTSYTYTTILYYADLGISANLTLKSDESSEKQRVYTYMLHSIIYIKYEYIKYKYIICV